MRFPARSFATLLMMVGVATCSDTPIAAVKTGTGPSSARFGRVALVPSFSKSAQYAASHLADFPGLRYDSVRVVLRRLPTNDIIRDTVIAFNPESPNLPLSLDVDLVRDGRQFDALIEYRRLDGVAIYSGHQTVEAYAPNDPVPPAKPILITFVGPGAKVKSISVSPKTLTLSGTQSVTLTVSAVDSSNNPISVPLKWESDNDVVGVNESGMVQGRNQRGGARITVSTPTGVKDVASITVALPPAAVTVVSGSGQSGKVGTQLANPAVVQVSAVDGIGVAGVSVVFSAPAGGSVSSATATTDADGRASTFLKLGTLAGPQGFAVVAAGFSAGISATGTPGDPSVVAVVSGGTQADSIHAALAPLVVRVSDSFNNPIPGVVVSWSKSGTGTLGAPTSTTDTNGQASNSYKLGGTLGAESVTASAGTGNASFGFTVSAGSPATITGVSGGGQSARVGQPLANPFVVKVADAAGNPVRNAAIGWSGENVTLSAPSASDANGQSSVTATAGGSAGAGAVIASIANGQRATFPVMILAGPPATATFSPGPSNVVAGQVIPSIRVLLRDVTNNPAEGVVTIALANNPNGAVLGGTLTQNTVSGVATFNNLSIARAGTGYTLQATTAGAVSVTSAPFNVSAGVVASMTVVAGNGSSARVNSAVTTPPSVKLVDGANNPIIGASVTFALGGGGSIAPAGGIVMTDAFGVATLTSWTLGTQAGTQTLTASSPGLQPVTFTATATPGNAFRLVLKNKASLQSSALSGALLTPQPAIQVTDEFGNAVPAGQMQVSVSPTTDATISGTTSLPLAPTSGAATFTDLKLVGIGSTRLVFRESTSQIKPDTSNAINVTAGPAVSLRLVPSTQTAFTFTAGQAVTLPQVQAVDAQGNGVAGVTVRAQVDSGTGPGSVVVGASDFTTSASGFASLVVPSATTAGNYRLTATSAGIADTLRITATVTPGPAYRVAFKNRTALQTSITSGSTLSPQPTIWVLDQYGNVVSAAGVNVTLTTAPATELSAPLSLTAGSGTYSGISLSGSGPMRLVVSATGASLKPDSSNTITVTPHVSTVASLTFVTSHGVPESFENNASFTNGPQLIAKDASGNPVAGVAIDVTVDSAISLPTSRLNRSGPSANFGMFTPLPTMNIASATTDANGIANFGGAKFRGKVQRFRLIFVARGTSVMIATSTALRHGAMSNASCSASLPGRVGLGHKLSNSPKLRIVDIDDNVIDNAAVTLTAVGTLSSNSGTTDSDGEVTVSTWTVRGSAGDDSLKVNGVNGACHVSAAALHHIKLSLNALGTKKNGDLIPSIDATIVDLDGNAIEDTTFTIQAVAHTHQDKQIFINKSKASNNHGKSTFDDLTVDAQAQDNATLDFSLSGATGVTGQMTLSVIDGDASDLDSGGALSVVGIPNTSITGTFSVQVKDHNKRNNVNSALSSVTWTFGTECREISFAAAASQNTATSPAVSGTALSPTIYIRSAFSTRCTVTASAPGLNGATFTITP